MAEEIGALRAVLALESAAFDRGVASARRQLTGLEGGFQKTGGQVVQFGSKMRDLDRFSRSGSAGLQNFGFQVQDFAVQVGAGTSASQALAQQLPQLLSGFGLLGIALGTASAVMIPLGSAILGLGSKANTLKDALDGVNTAMQSTSDLAKIAQGDLDGLQERYGVLTPEVLRFVEAQKQVGLRELADASLALNEQLTALYNGNAWLNRGRAEDLANALGLGTKASRELANALDALGKADSLEQQLAITTQIRDRFTEMVGPVMEMTSRQRDFYFAVVDTEDAQRALLDRVQTVEASVARLASPLEMALLLTDSLASAASGLSSYFSSAEGAVAGLANMLGKAAQNAWGLAQARIASDRAGMQYSGRGSDPRQFMAGQSGSFNIEHFDVPKLVGGGARRSGGGGGGGGMSETAREAARVFAETRTEAEKYAIEVDKLNKLLAAGGISQDTFNRAIDGLKEKAGEAAGAATQLESSFQDAFASFVTGASSAQDAVASLLQDLAGMLANRAFQSLMGAGGSGIFASIGKVLGFANGGAFANGRVQAFAAGGIVNGPTVFPMANGAGLMGEAGPEAIMPLTRIGGKLGVRAAGGGNTTVQIDARYATEGTAEMIVKAIQRAAPGIVKQSVSANRAAGARGY
jgi:hypothetical protein